MGCKTADIQLNKHYNIYISTIRNKTFSNNISTFLRFELEKTFRRSPYFTIIETIKNDKAYNNLLQLSIIIKRFQSVTTGLYNLDNIDNKTDYY